MTVPPAPPFNTRLCVLIRDAEGMAPLPERVGDLLGVGVKCFRLLSDRPDESLHASLTALEEPLATAGAKLLLTDRPELCRSFVNTGLLIDQLPLAAAAARQLLGPGRLIGRKICAAAKKNGDPYPDVDFFALGPVFPASGKADADYFGLAGLYSEVRRHPVPLLAWGAVSRESFPVVLATGVAAVEMDEAVWTSKNPAAAARGLLIMAGEGPVLARLPVLSG